jgi:hypothetical protein
VREVIPLPVNGEVLTDVRGEARALRVSTHEEAGLVVVSIWRGDTCTASAWLTREDAARLVAALAAGLAGTATDEPILGSATP